MIGQGSGWDGEYAELGAMTNFSFLEGASHPGEIMHQAKALGLAAVGVADRNTLAGVVRAWSALKTLREEGWSPPDRVRQGGGPGETRGTWTVTRV
mgnify:CR=1 FL=1